mmetsp:Transcript_11788/g.13582  ORF Transcript_11788/g.13582 Transcript_11788/m.13582 type:complete len:320 (+) Transcript_11788:126-1085(+)
MDIWVEGFPGGATSVFATALVALVSFLYLAWTFSNRGSSGNDEVFLNRKRQTVSLKRRVELSHDVHLLRFALPSENLTLGLPVGKHFKLFAPNRDGVVQGEWNGRADSDKGEVIERKYTPTTSNDEKGYFDLVVKIYKGGVVERFPDGGKMSQYLGSLKVGEQISISGPWGINEYIGNGEFAFMKKKTKFKHIGMIAGGTGITPMLQIIDAVLKNKSDATTLSLIFANKTVEDILLKDKLDMLSQQYPKRFRVHYTLDSPPADWKYSTGFVNADMIKENLPSASENSVVLLCGPPPMIKFACKPNLEKLGFEKSQVREF